jgi:hypothetical protein
MKPRYDAHGKLNFWLILPSRALRNLVYHKLTEEYPQLNYCLEWNDVQGFGLQLTVVEWKTSGIYHVPN